MGKQQVILGRSTLTPVENKERHIVTLPGEKSQDFILSAKCRIVNVGGRVSMSVADLPGDSNGSYIWSSTSDKIRLVNTTGAVLVIEALANPSAARDSELVTVTRIAHNGVKTSKTVRLTVAKVTFSSSPAQRYGYDNFDTPLDQNDDHISVKSNGETAVAVKIEGGALGTDFDFVSDDALVCTIDKAPEAIAFDLRIRAKSWQKKATLLKAKVKCSASTIFAQIKVHVYTEKFVKVLIAKVANNSFSATSLKYPSADYTGHQVLANNKLREGVVKFELSNFDPENAVTNIDFGRNIDGALIFDINNGGGLEFDLISSVIGSSDPDQCRVVIIRNIKSYYYLDRPARRGDMSISVRGANVFKAKMPLGKGPTMEMVDVVRNVGNVGYLNQPLTFDHAAGETVEFPAGAWSGDPIIISEGDDSLDISKWTILHEVGHSALELQDIEDPTNFMHWAQSWTDWRLRYCPRNYRYQPGVSENQWEIIPRPLPKPPNA